MMRHRTHLAFAWLLAPLIGCGGPDGVSDVPSGPGDGADASVDSTVGLGADSAFGADGAGDGESGGAWEGGGIGDAGAGVGSVRFLIMSDIHVTKKGLIPAQFARVVELAKGRRPAFVVVTGDSTSGNPNDGVASADVDAWWTAFRSAITPLREAGIAVLPVAGNHDYYTEAHQRAYAKAWSALASETPSLKLRSLSTDSSAPVEATLPHSYAFELKGAHFLLLHMPEHRLSADLESALRAERSRAGATGPVFAFGHVPLRSIMGTLGSSYTNKMVRVLSGAGIDAYFGGHEHLLWDEVISAADAGVRQVLVGTASGTYNYGPNADARARASCVSEGASRMRCAMPSTGRTFAIDAYKLPEGGVRWEQEHSVSLVEVEIREGAYTVTPLALAESGLVPFYDP